jgi:hypothetical protein
MSRVEKLKALLAKVEQRRAEPRLVAVAGGAALSTANTNVASRREAPLELARPPAPVAAAPEPLSFEDSLAPPSSIPPPSVHEAETKLRSSLPPPNVAARAPQTTGPSSTVPPAAPARPRSDEAPASTPAERPAARSSTEVLPATPSRIVPSPALPFESAVAVTSSPRVDSPKSFGELLEQSLALRPKSG